MKLYFESTRKLSEGKLDLSFEARDTIKHKVYNALSDIAFKYKHVDPKVLQDAMEDALDWWEDRFWDFDFEYDEYDEFEECFVEDDLYESKDLSNKKGTIASVLAKNYKSLMQIPDKDRLRQRVIELFVDNGIDTEYSRKMMRIMGTKRTLLDLQSYITNVYLAGSGDGVIK